MQWMTCYSEMICRVPISFVVYAMKTKVVGIVLADHLTTQHMLTYGSFGFNQNGKLRQGIY